jgi:hypothetical protein
VTREYSAAAFGFVNVVIIAVGGLFLRPLIGILAQMRQRQLPDAGPLSILIWAQGLALVLLIPLILRSRKKYGSPLESPMARRVSHERAELLAIHREGMNF